MAALSVRRCSVEPGIAKGLAEPGAGVPGRCRSKDFSTIRI